MTKDPNKPGSMVKLNSTDGSGKNGREEARSTALYLLIPRVELCIGRRAECKNASRVAQQSRDIRFKCVILEGMRCVQIRYAEQG